MRGIISRRLRLLWARAAVVFLHARNGWNSAAGENTGAVSASVGKRKLREPRRSFHMEKTVMPDIDITCAECGNAFPFTEREQDYYQERNLSQPKRCKQCRDARRANFGGGGGGGRGAGGGERQRFEITCDQCGKSDTVPFKPSTGRPVLCGECFSAGRAQ